MLYLPRSSHGSVTSSVSIPALDRRKVTTRGKWFQLRHCRSLTGPSTETPDNMGSILSMQWPVPSSKRTRQLPDSVLVMAGAFHQMRGRVSVLRGTLFHNDILRAMGHRQQLVGMLQRFWKRDRPSIELWVDTVLRKNIAPPTIRKTSWRGGSSARMLHQES